MNIDVTWTNLKSLVSSKNLYLQYTESSVEYNIWVSEEDTKYFTVIHIDNPANTDQADFEDNYKSGANQPIPTVIAKDGVSADIITSGGKNRLGVDAEINVEVEDFICFDNYASTYFTVTNAGSVGDTIDVEIDTPAIVDVTSTLTATEAGDEDATASLVASDLEDDSSFNTKFIARALDDKVYVISKDAAEKGEYPNVSPDDFRVTVTGTTTVNIPNDFNRIIRRNKLILGEGDSLDNRYARIGVFGEVGSRTKAENPINISVRKTLATAGQIIFSDKTVPSGQIWYIGGVAVADELNAEFSIFEGVERDKVESWTADGTLFTEELDYHCLKSGDYHTVLVNDAGTWIEGTDYVIEDSSSNGDSKSQLRWIKSQTVPSDGDTVKITYDAVIRRLGLFVQASTSQPYTFEAPVKLAAGRFIISTVENKAANAGVVIANISGFFEEVY